MYKTTHTNFEFLRDMFYMNYGGRIEHCLLRSSSLCKQYVEIDEDYACQLLKYIDNMITHPGGQLESRLKESWITNNPAYIDTLKQIKKELNN